MSPTTSKTTSKNSSDNIKEGFSISVFIRNLVFLSGLILLSFLATRTDYAVALCEKIVLNSGGASTAAFENIKPKKMPATDALARKYFEAWNSQDLGVLGETLDEKVTLRDWDIAAEGKSKVVEANGNIFKAVPAIKIEVLNIFESKSDLGPAAACEILVKVSDSETLKVTDIIQFNDAGLITAVRAYKG
ncbi:unnamed protein product [Amoebophrya sp. A25]|nr:unnamed protein product [Amoebophrya sp. A25]|eukprot:GSA25T00006820001.1